MLNNSYILHCVLGYDHGYLDVEGVGAGGAADRVSYRVCNVSYGLVQEKITYIHKYKNALMHCNKFKRHGKGGRCYRGQGT